MKLTKYEHSCLLVEQDGAQVLIDPGTFSSGWDNLTGLAAVLITHQHSDHVDVERLRPLLERNSQAALYTDVGTAAALAESGIAATAVQRGDRLDVGFGVDVHGSDHAVIHPDVPVIPNVCYLLGGRFFHPGDSFTVPDVKIDILGLPTGAPWLKVSEAVDYLRAVEPRIALPIHEAVLAKPGMVYGLFERLKPETATVQVIPPGETFEF